MLKVISKLSLYNWFTRLVYQIYYIFFNAIIKYIFAYLNYEITTK